MVHHHPQCFILLFLLESPAASGHFSLEKQQRQQLASHSTQTDASLASHTAVNTNHSNCVSKESCMQAVWRGHCVRQRAELQGRRQAAAALKAKRQAAAVRIQVC